MSYTMELFPDQLKRYPIPKIGEIFIVTGIQENILNLHFGICTVIVLRPITKPKRQAETINDIERLR
jgi:hypothetical protein